MPASNEGFEKLSNAGVNGGVGTFCGPVEEAFGRGCVDSGRCEEGALLSVVLDVCILSAPRFCPQG